MGGSLLNNHHYERYTNSTAINNLYSMVVHSVWVMGDYVNLL